MRLAWSVAPWCFHSLRYACGSPANSSRSHMGRPSASVTTTLALVQSSPTPITSAGSTPESAMAPRTASSMATR